MKYVINSGYGGFDVSDNWLTAHGFKRSEINEDLRRNINLINDIESGHFENVRFSNLVVVEIPDEATDWELFDYDGAEYIIAVVDGKLVQIDFSTN